MKMNLCLYVQDFYIQIGHTRALVDIIRHSDHSKFEKIHIIAYESDSSEELFPNFSGEVIFHRVPFGFLRPHLVRNIFYHFYTLIYTLFFIPRGTYRISIGFASLIFDLANIQFFHKAWEEGYFQVSQLKGWRRLYKKILFGYYVFLEHTLYKRKHVRLMANSDYIKEFCMKDLSVPENKIQRIYSGINPSDFSPQFIPREQLLNELVPSYKNLANIDLSKPIFLFVGAFERKGLREAIADLDSLPGSQLIIVGKGEGHIKFKSKSCELFFVGETREIGSFYELADSFIFPTLYEPFGLVLVEAAIYGLPIFTRKKHVGASELLENGPEVYFRESDYLDDLKNVNILSQERRKEIIKNRQDLFNELDWSKSAEKFQSFIEEHHKELRNVL